MREILSYNWVFRSEIEYLFLTFSSTNNKFRDHTARERWHGEFQSVSFVYFISIWFWAMRRNIIEFLVECYKKMSQRSNIMVKRYILDFRVRFGCLWSGRKWSMRDRIIFCCIFRTKYSCTMNSAHSSPLKLPTRFCLMGRSYSFLLRSHTCRAPTTNRPSKNDNKWIEMKINRKIHDMCICSVCLCACVV